MASICMFLDVMYWRIPWEINVEFTTECIESISKGLHEGVTFRELLFASFIISAFLCLKCKYKYRKGEIKWSMLSISHCTSHIESTMKFYHDSCPYSNCDIILISWYSDLWDFFVFVVLFVFESRPVQIFLRCIHICSFICIWYLHPGWWRWRGRDGYNVVGPEVGEAKWNHITIP